MRKSGKEGLCVLLILALLLVVAGSARADVNIRVKNMANKVKRLITARFLKGYHLIDKNEVIKKGVGKLGGNGQVVREFFPKPAAQYYKMVSDKSILKCKETRIVVKVEIFHNDKEAAKVKIKKMDSGSFSGETIGIRTWSASVPKMDVKRYKEKMALKNKKDDKKTEDKKTNDKKLSPREKREMEQKQKKAQAEEAKKDEEIAKKLNSDPTNYNVRQLIVLKENVIIQISAINYNKMPSSNILEDIARRLVPKI